MSLDKIKEAVLKASRTEAEHINAAAANRRKKAGYQKENLRREFSTSMRPFRLIRKYAPKLAHFRGTAGKST